MIDIILRSSLHAHPEAHVLQLRISGCQYQKVYERRGHWQRHVLIGGTDNWSEKAKRRKTTGTGRLRHMQHVPRKAKNGFKTGGPTGARGAANPNPSRSS